MTTPNAGTLFLVRHGRTDANQDRYVGWANPPLNSEGIRQSAMLSDALADERIDRIYASPLLRALQTALPLASPRQLEIDVRTELRELNYGEYEGVRKAPGSLRLRRTHRYARLPGGESLFDLYCRVRPFSEEIADVLRSGHRIAVVGHFWTNRMLIGCLGGSSFDAIVEAPAYKPANGSVFEVTFRPAARGVSMVAAELRAHYEGLAS